MSSTKETTKRYVLYCAEYGKYLGKNSFKQKYVKGDGNYLRHLIMAGKMYNWYQIIDTTKSGNFVIKEGDQSDRNDF